MVQWSLYQSTHFYCYLVYVIIMYLSVLDLINLRWHVCYHCSCTCQKTLFLYVPQVRNYWLCRSPGNWLIRQEINPVQSKRAAEMHCWCLKDWRRSWPGHGSPSIAWSLDFKGDMLNYFKEHTALKLHLEICGETNPSQVEETGWALWCGG